MGLKLLFVIGSAFIAFYGSLEFYLDHHVYGWIIVFFGAMWSLCGLAVLRWSDKRRKLEEMLKRRRDTWTKTAARFPPEHVFRFSEYVLRHVHKDKDFEALKYTPHFNEELEPWLDLMREYPTPPVDEDDRQQREIMFWKKYADRFTKTNSERLPVISHKQEIMDYFKLNERFLFREYYAATGIVKDTIAKLHADLLYDLYSQQDYNNKNGFHIDSNTEKYSDPLWKMWRETMPAHYQKWGDWFFFNIQEAFKKNFKQDAPFGPKSATGSQSNSAQDELGYRPNS